MPVTKRKPKDDEQSVTSDSKQPIKNVPALMGEGEKFFRDQLYDKAIQCYTEALELSPGNINALVERSTCYLKIGKNELALADAEESLKENKEFTKGLYQKAEALYAMGEFELALVFYHRGKKLRGDVREFQLGINKAQEAIDNCVGDPTSVKLEIKGDLSYFDRPDEKNKKKMNVGYQKPFAQKQQVVQKREKRVLKPGKQKTIKQLLGELYADKVYLENLLQDDHATRANTKSGDAIWNLANSGLDFLDSRTEFWRQQKPIYARKKSRQSYAPSKTPLTYVLNQLEVIDGLQTNGKHSESLDKSNKLMIYVNKLTDTQLTDRKSIVSNIYSNIGNAYLEMGKYELSLKNHQKDLDISTESDNKEGISRAYENLGRVYARNGKYNSAIDVWEKKLPLAESDMEKAWLHHEIGRCHLELGSYKVAEDFGNKSLDYSDKISDEVWKLNATILIAQSQAKIGDEENLTKAIENFEKAFEMTEKQNKEENKPEENKKEDEQVNDIENSEEKENKQDEDNTQQNQNSKVAEKRDGLGKSPDKGDSTNRSKNSSSSKDTSSDNLTLYRIEIRTADDMSSGTDAQVFMDVVGTNGNLSDIELKDPVNSESLFERDALNKFEIKLKDVGKVKKLAFITSGTGSGASWKLATVKLYDNEHVYLFTVNKWIDSKTEIQPDSEPTPKSELSEFTVTVVTSNKLGAGTDSNVFINIFGENGETGKLALDRREEKGKLFDKGNTDTFIVETKNVGDIKKINLSHDGKGIGAGWHIDRVEITNNNVTKKFPIDRWLDEDEGDGKTEIDLEPDVKPN
ncbi:tetratricopeptide repeat 25 [Brachionus plicatilis]|uniref:Outer dynein arm-docking complex subunit 4 n=1 Tax=Brachionus plicatilis TaxID=10195 RepID=A0A3M7PSB1_BRAPC|nr:tetratricopeptide repeat 25 [Brachionus plicatilis]